MHRSRSFGGAPVEAPLRLAVKSDLEGMRGVYEPYLATPATFDLALPEPQRFEALLGGVNRDFPCLVAMRRGRVAGFAAAHALASRAAYRWQAELSVYLERGSHARGWGGALYDALLALLRLQGVIGAYALVTLPNPASVGLHESRGFKLAWVQSGAGWKDGAWHDVAWFEKALAPRTARPAEPQQFCACARAHEEHVRAVLCRANFALQRFGG